MKKLLLGISIAALAITSMQDSCAGIFTKKSPEQQAQEKEQKEQKKTQEANLKAMKTCASDLTQQTLKLIKAFITCIDKLKDTAVMKDASPNTAESVNKVLLIRDAANDFLRLLLYCYAGCVQIENALKEKEGSDAQKSYYLQAMDARVIISNLRANLGIDIVSLIELTTNNNSEIFNAKKVKEVIKKLDGDLRGTGKKNDVGLSTAFESALKKFEDQAIVYYGLSKDEALDMADDEAKEYPLFDFVTTGKHLETIREILTNIFPAFVAFGNDVCDGKSNNGSSFIQSVRQALKIKGLQVFSELEYDENEAKAKKSRRQGNNNKLAKKKYVGKGSSAEWNNEAEDAENYELSEEDEEFFESEKEKSAKKRGSKADKRSNEGKVKKTEDDEELEEAKASAKSKKKSKEAEDDSELDEEDKDFFKKEKQRSADKRKAKAEEEDEDVDDAPVPEEDADEEDSTPKKGKVTKKDVEKMDEALNASKKRRQSEQTKGTRNRPSAPKGRAVAASAA